MTLPSQLIRKCRDCLTEGITTNRPAPHPGPRCDTHNRAKKKAVKAARRESRLKTHFGITAAESDQIQAFQGGGCICYEWTGYNGYNRALSTDHDHDTGLIRGKLCKHCNDLLGRVRDDPRYFERMIEYLKNPPAVQVLGERYVPET